MKRTILGVTAITIAMLVTGCGSETEEVATDFISALSSGDKEEAKELASTDIIKKIDNMQNHCNMVVSKKLENQTITFLQKVKKAEKDIKNKDTKNKDKINAIREKYEEKKKELVKEFDKGKEPNHQFEREEAKEFNKKLFPLTLEMVQDVIEAVDIEDENQEQMEKVIAWNEQGLESGYASLRVIEETPVEFSPECVDSVSVFGFVDDINILEVKEITADEEVVRLEVINKKGDSNKIEMHVEKIKGDWLVSDY